MRKPKEFIKIGNVYFRKSLISSLDPIGFIRIDSRTYAVPTRSINRVARELGIVTP